MIHLQRSRIATGVAAAALALLGLSSPAMGGGKIDLGEADYYAVLAATTITNVVSPGTLITGDIGVWPNPSLDSITGFPPGQVIGDIHHASASAMQAQIDSMLAYATLQSLTPTGMPGMELGGMTLTPGVYFFPSSAEITSTLTLDAQGDPNAQFVFQMGSTLVTAADSAVEIINDGGGCVGCNVYWQVGSSATLGARTDFTGNILALASITMVTDASIIDGRAIALTGAVTLDSNIIDAGPCIPGPGACLLLGPVFLLGSLAPRRRSA